MSHLEKSEISTIIELSVQNTFNKPPKWSFAILRFLIIILVPLLSNVPDIQLNFYTINVVF